MLAWIVLLLIYIVIIYGIFRLVRHVFKSNGILISFLIFGVVAGLAIYTVWPSEGIGIYNLPAMHIGDEIYQLSIQNIGNTHSLSAHNTIPWILRIPQIYIFVSIAFWGFFGSLIQLFVVLKRINTNENKSGQN